MRGLAGLLPLELAGTEELTIEATGTVLEDAAFALVRPGLEIEAAGGRAAVSLLVFQMRRLGARGLPGPRFDYGEALWRLGVSHHGRAAWLAVACDLDHPVVRAFGRALVRYPVRKASFVLERDGARRDAAVTTARGAFVVRAIAGDEQPAALPPRPVLVSHAGALYRIPWREDPAPERRAATVEVVVDDLGAPTFGAPVTWDARGLVHAGRVHRCGLAHPVT